MRRNYGQNLSLGLCNVNAKRNPPCMYIVQYVWDLLRYTRLWVNSRKVFAVKLHVRTHIIYRVAAINPEFFSSYFQMTQQS